jgi:hypothetical protein
MRERKRVAGWAMLTLAFVVIFGMVFNAIGWKAFGAFGFSMLMTAMIWKGVEWTV